MGNLLVDLNRLRNKEEAAVSEIRQQAALEAFTKKIWDCTNEKFDGDEIKKLFTIGEMAAFESYSGFRQGGFLGYFFKLARFVDSRNFKFDEDTSIRSRLSGESDGLVYDKKPWDCKWVEIPYYTRDFLFDRRSEISQVFTKLKAETPETGGGDTAREKLAKYTFQFGSSTKNDFLEGVGKAFDKMEPEVRRLFLGIAAVAGTSYPINQVQSDNRSYIQGYIMNVLTPERGGKVQEYYEASTMDGRAGCLSGPSGTSRRFHNLVKLLYANDDEFTKLYVAALCVAALDVPYNNHSLYEIMTIVMPDSPRLFVADNFKEAALANFKTPFNRDPVEENFLNAPGLRQKS